MNDAIQTYVMTVEAGVRWLCPTCHILRLVWVGETVGGDTLTVCGNCQRILLRRRTADITPLRTN